MPQRQHTNNTRYTLTTTSNQHNQADATYNIHVYNNMLIFNITKQHNTEANPIRQIRRTANQVLCERAPFALRCGDGNCSPDPGSVLRKLILTPLPPSPEECFFRDTGMAKCRGFVAPIILHHIICYIIVCFHYIVDYTQFA